MKVDTGVTLCSSGAPFIPNGRNFNVTNRFVSISEPSSLAFFFLLYESLRLIGHGFYAYGKHGKPEKVEDFFHFFKSFIVLAAVFVITFSNEEQCVKHKISIRLHWLLYRLEFSIGLDLPNCYFWKILTRKLFRILQFCYGQNNGLRL